MNVFILATCRKRELLPYTVLVFKTLRIGFPRARIQIHLNGAKDDNGMEEEVRNAAFSAGLDFYGCDFHSIQQTTHHEWIEKLISSQQEMFWVVDTDVIFYAQVENWSFREPLAGALIPEFHDPFTKAITRSRLHTSLMCIQPALVRAELQRYRDKHPATIYNPPANLFHPLYLPFNGRTYFYDTLALAYHAIGGEPFDAQMKDSYFHFHFGSCSDVVLPSMPQEMHRAREVVLADPRLGMGMWRAQEEWFVSRQFAEDGVNVIAPIDTKDADEARKWNVELCKGDQGAMLFCDLWYRYCHGIDDLIDTLQDGRPRMSKDQMISLFWQAAIFYNCDFFVRNRDLLSPIVLDITDTYRNSVAWERSSKVHLRTIGDVLRTCGNRMYAMVALICGGEAHMRQMSLAITERDYLLQHDANGNPK
jgi:hypothetical protein